MPPKTKAKAKGRVKAVRNLVVEGQTHLAKIVKCPWAYRKIEGQRSTVGDIVKVEAYGVVTIEWPSGGKNSVPRDCVKLIEDKSPVAVFSLTPEAEAARVEAGAKAMWKHYGTLVSWPVLPWKDVSPSAKRDFRDKASSVLQALGLAKR